MTGVGGSIFLKIYNNKCKYNLSFYLGIAMMKSI